MKSRMRMCRVKATPAESRKDNKMKIRTLFVIVPSQRGFSSGHPPLFLNQSQADQQEIGAWPSKAYENIDKDHAK